MRGFLAFGLGAAILIGSVGCGGGGIEEGVPANTKPDVDPATMKPDMAAQKLNPNNLPKGSETGDEVKKK